MKTVQSEQTEGHLLAFCDHQLFHKVYGCCCPQLEDLYFACRLVDGMDRVLVLDGLRQVRVACFGGQVCCGLPGGLLMAGLAG